MAASEPETFAAKSAPEAAKAPDSAPAVASAAVAVASVAAASVAVAASVAPKEVGLGLPSYESSRDSSEYKAAKALLAEGAFEAALEVLEGALVQTQSKLASVLGDNQDQVDCHPSIAPLQYLYGTTLLYSIEESTDQQMTVAGSQQQQTQHQNQNQELQDVTAAVADQQQQQEQPPPAPPEDNVEDIEIAWENLDSARNIVEQLLLETTTSEQQRKSSYQLDLAQILLREGDLQRMNGRYQDAIQDYSASLALRQQALPSAVSPLIADVQYNLGLSYLSSSLEILKQDENTTTSTPTTTPTTAVSDPVARQELGKEHCLKGVDSYMACAKTLLGEVLQLLAVESSPAEDLFAPTSGLKTTGLVETPSPIQLQSQTLQGWRTKAASLLKSSTNLLQNEQRCQNLFQMLEEIQETIDEAERSQVAIRQAAQLKEQAAKDAEGEDEATAAATTTNTAGPTTTIGFGNVDATKLAAAQTLPVTTTMVVKKRKKAPPAAQSTVEDAAKRTKTE